MSPASLLDRDDLTLIRYVIRHQNPDLMTIVPHLGLRPLDESERSLILAAIDAESAPASPASRRINHKGEILSGLRSKVATL